MKHRKRDDELTPEEKEVLKKLMETPGIENEWDFFEDMSKNIPPPEYFMRGKPEHGHKWAVYVAIAIVAGVIGWLIGQL